MMELLKGIKLPEHIAIIMDGNGRWALQKGWQRIKGHEAGAEVVDEITTECAKIGIKRLTLYAFSEENWQRTRGEVDFLLSLLKKYLIEKREKILKNNIIFRVIGRIHKFPEDIQQEIQKTQELSSKNSGMILCLALSYSGRAEIVDAIKKIAKDVKENKIDIDQIDENLLSCYMYDPEFTEPELLIRTGGELRVSNFLLWHITYTEFWSTKTLWPDFKKEELYQAIMDFSKRHRRFGKV